MSKWSEPNFVSFILMSTRPIGLTGPSEKNKPDKEKKQARNYNRKRKEKKQFVFNKAYWARRSIFSLAHHRLLAHLPSLQRPSRTNTTQ
jgi:hypothetical protein